MGCSRAGTKNLSFCLSEDVLLFLGCCMKNDICIQVSGSGRQEVVKLVSQAEEWLCSWCLADEAGAVTCPSVFLFCAAPFLPCPPTKAKWDTWTVGCQAIWSWVAAREKRQFLRGVWVVGYLINTWNMKVRECEKNMWCKFGAKFWMEKTRAVLIITKGWTAMEERMHTKFVLEITSLKRRQTWKWFPWPWHTSCYWS